MFTETRPGRQLAAFLGLLLLAITFASPARAVVTVSGTISTNTVWTASPDPIYHVIGNVNVNPGVTLTIEPGVTVKFGLFTQLQVQGNLQAIGGALPATKIYFTSIRDDNLPPGGDDTNGTLFVQVADKTGKLFPFFYDVLTYLYIWAEIEVEPGENWPQAGDPYAGIQADVAAFIEALGSADNRSGEDVRVSDLPIALYPPAQGGAPRGVSQWRVRLAATPTPAGPPVYGPWFPTDTDDQELASIAIGSREKARGSVARVTVSPL